MSLSDDKAAVADTKTVTVNHVAGQMVYSSTFTNLVNGRSYVPRVITRYTYQSNQGQKFKLTEGAFLNQPNTITSDFQVVNGRADVKTRVGTTAYQSSAGGTGVIAVPGGIPIITPTLTGTNAGLQIDDNGRPLTFGAMIQIVGKPNNTVAAAANSFYIDLSTTVQSGGNAILDTKDAFKDASFRKVHTLQNNLIGNNWATEKNYIFAANSVGTRVVTTNISTAQLQASGANIVELNSAASSY